MNVCCAIASSYVIFTMGGPWREGAFDRAARGRARLSNYEPRHTYCTPRCAWSIPAVGHGDFAKHGDGGLPRTRTIRNVGYGAPQVSDMATLPDTAMVTHHIFVSSATFHTRTLRCGC